MKNVNFTYKEILDRIEYFRNKKKISAYKLGLELGHSKTYFYRVESGEIQLTIEKFLDILDVLEVTTSEFFNTSIDSIDEELLNLISELSDENKRIIVDLIGKLK